MSQRSLAELSEVAASDRERDLKALLVVLEGDPRRGATVLAGRVRSRLRRIRREKARDRALRRFDDECRGTGWLAGCDEVGRGPLAGPLVACAVILRAGTPILGLDDSKRLTEAQRMMLVPTIVRATVAWAVAVTPVRAIDRSGVGEANRRALMDAVNGLPCRPEVVLSDHMPLPDLEMRQLPISHGDQKSQSIAAASVLAKVIRDELMRALAAWVPGYDFEHNVGYAAPMHIRALRTMGPSVLHRLSFLGFLQDASSQDPG